LQQIFYQTWLFDAIVTDSFTFRGSRQWMYDGKLSQVLANQNQQRAFIQGFTTQVVWDFLPGWKLESGLSYTYGRIREGQHLSPLDHISPLFGRAAIQYTSQKWNAVVFCVWNGRKSIADYKLNGEDNEAYAPPGGMPAWQTWNLRTSYQINLHLLVFAGIENLLDTQYRTFSSGINGAGRHFSLSLRGSF
jgi:hemoglobin/transferrin/lactoferrin receptor protein